MVIIRGLEALKERYRDVILTIGNFDGVHRGHQKIFTLVVDKARAVRGTAMAMTFEPHPVRVLAPERGVKVLTPFEEKARLMERYGIDVLLCIHFTKEFSNTKPDDFIRDVVVNRIGAKEVIVGHNYSFGKGKKGTTDLLRRRGKKYGIAVKVVRSARMFGDAVSSSRIRSLIGRGRVCEASWLLGRPYMIEGSVVRGEGRGGKVIGVPTANIMTRNDLIPREGVYAVKVNYEGTLLDGVANLGRNPTFGIGGLSYEIHILDFAENILGKNLRVYFIDRIRDEKTFPDVSSLKEQILKDLRRAQDVLRNKKYPTVL
ncbi:MAG TPA: bifunctional riboflavin kinase/FAD synthetase [Thermodesulfovibrionales bacterium]|nr:bifunctional riboflavin kinase/FAD synthetase [Thermodesulfovibrionales bacterium]